MNPLTHTAHCDRDLCSTDCPSRAAAETSDQYWTGRQRAGDSDRRLRIERARYRTGLN